MAIPATREDFKKTCLRLLGDGAIKINVTDEQVDDCVDYALSFWWDYHYDGMQQLYYKHQITDEDKANKYIILPENIIGAVRIFDLGSALGQGDIFNIQYQIALNDLYTLTSADLAPYYMTIQHFQFMEQLLVGKKPIRYNRHTNRLDIDMTWDYFDTGQYLVVEAYEVIDPDTYPDVWKDRLLREYCAAQIQLIWARNLSKYKGLAMPGGVQFNADELKREATDTIARLETDMRKNALLPPIMIG